MGYDYIWDMIINYNYIHKMDGFNINLTTLFILLEDYE